eukprot:281385_1
MSWQSLVFEIVVTAFFFLIAAYCAVNINLEAEDNIARRMVRGAIKKLFDAAYAVNAWLSRKVGTGTNNAAVRNDSGQSNKAFKGKQHSMIGNQNENNLDSLLRKIKPQKIGYSPLDPNTTIQIIFINGTKETLKINLRSRVSEIYAHFKAVSGYKGQFSLIAGFPPKLLSNANGTVESEKLKGTSIIQKKLITKSNSFFSKLW